MSCGRPPNATRYLSSGYAAVSRANRRARPHAYDPQRCAVELQKRGELERACAVIARTAFRLVMVVPGGVVLSLAGAAIVGGREVGWPQVKKRVFVVGVEIDSAAFFYAFFAGGDASSLLSPRCFCGRMIICTDRCSWCEGCSQGERTLNRPKLCSRPRHSSIAIRPLGGRWCMGHVKIVEFSSSRARASYAPPGANVPVRHMC